MQLPKNRNSNHDNIMNRNAEQGNTNTYALRKLRKDAPDLHAQVISGEISPHAAMVKHTATVEIASGKYNIFI